MNSVKLIKFCNIAALVLANHVCNHLDIETWLGVSSPPKEKNDKNSNISRSKCVNMIDDQNNKSICLDSISNGSWVQK